MKIDTQGHFHDDTEILDWANQVKQAKARPAMFIGSQQNAHRAFVSQALQLVWKAKAFRQPVSTTIYLSPNQYIVRCETGPLLSTIETLFTWENKSILTSGWKKTMAKLRDDYQTDVLDDKNILRGWRRYFGSPTGPTLDSPTFPAILAKKFIFAYRTSAGFRGQIFQEGFPVEKPFLISKPDSAVGILILAELDPEWFIGLPFTKQDVEILANTTNITVEWHSKDDLMALGTNITSLL